MPNVLITGGSGLIGNHLTKMLFKKGYTVGHLTRSDAKKPDNIKLFTWHVDNGEIDEMGHEQAKGFNWRNQRSNKTSQTYIQQLTSSLYKYL